MIATTLFGRSWRVPADWLGAGIVVVAILLSLLWLVYLGIRTVMGHPEAKRRLRKTLTHGVDDNGADDHPGATAHDADDSD